MAGSQHPLRHQVALLRLLDLPWANGNTRWRPLICSALPKCGQHLLHAPEVRSPSSSRRCARLPAVAASFAVTDSVTLDATLPRPNPAHRCPRPVPHQRTRLAPPPSRRPLLDVPCHQLVSTTWHQRVRLQLALVASSWPPPPAPLRLSSVLAQEPRVLPS